MIRHRLPAPRLAAAITLALAATACRPTPKPTAPAPKPAGPVPLQMQQPIQTLGAHRIVPMPVSVTEAAGAPFALVNSATVVVPAGSAEAAAEGARVGEMLARQLRPSTGFQIPVTRTDGAAPRGALVLRLDGPASLGPEGYEVTITADSVRLSAAAPAGLFHATQTLRQLFPAPIDAELSAGGARSLWVIPAGRIVDQPRFSYRGGMLDVARHFFTVDEVKQYIDLLALYKLNMLHLHLSDDQGWRIQIDSWPKLTQIGAQSEVGGRGSGFYTKAEYGDLVRYAGERFITVVPEIDMPAHTHAAIASYPELGCGRAIPDTSLNAAVQGLYTGTRVGFSALCPASDTTYKFVDDVVRELVAMTPGPFIHLGGDEVQALTHEQYAAFVERVQDIVAKYGKRMIGWDEIGRATLRPGTVSQLWRGDTATSLASIRQGAKVIMSPAQRMYLDMKYNPATELGLRWAAFIPLEAAYGWNPVTFFPSVTESDILGMEAPLWSETVKNITAAEYLLLPRLPAIAELAWSPESTHDWQSFRRRIAAHAPRWRLLGMNFYPSPEVTWEP